MVNNLQRLWNDTCTIQITGNVTKPNGATGKGWETLCKNEPCKVSFFYNNTRLTSPASGGVAAFETVQQTKLFIRADLNIPAGSRITVITHKNAKVLYYESSGIPAVFTNHQEILIEGVQKWA